MAPIQVEEVSGGKALSRFTDLPRALHGEDPRFAPPVVAWERYRVDRHRNPYLASADWAFLLARRAGRPVGRIAVHLPPGGQDARFGLWSCVDHPAVAEVLVGEVATWAAERGRPALVGPWSFAPGEGHGLLVAGFGTAGTTGRPWAPESEAIRLREALAALGPVEVVERTALWRLPTDEREPTLPPGGAVPGHAGRYGDPRLALDGAAAVPDLSAALRATGLRGAWALARRAGRREWEGCTAVRWTVEPRRAAVELLGAAGRAGYRWAVVPWSPDAGAPPEAVHERLRVVL